jgi:RNA polymerase sigma-70 factor, ECF subfamily
MEMPPHKLELFTQHRAGLFALAQQMLGNAADAEDILQDAYLRWQSAITEEIRFPKAYLTTIVTRLCLNHLSRARVKREETFGATIPDRLSFNQTTDPSDCTRLAEALAMALRVLLESLSPVERAVFLLRDVFDCDYAEVAHMVGKSDENCRQILRRARERIAGRQARFDVSLTHHEHTVQQFLQASRTGDWQALMTLVAADAVLLCDGADVSRATPEPVRGSLSIREFLQSRAQTLFPADATFESTQLIGLTALIAYQDQRPKTAFVLDFRGEHVSHLLVITCPVRLRSLIPANSPDRRDARLSGEASPPAPAQAVCAPAV